MVRKDARCFLDICPVKAASDAKSGESQSCHWHFVTFLIKCTDLRCFFRSAPVAKEAPQTVPQGMIHWQDRDVLGMSMAERRSCVVLRASVAVAARGFLLGCLLGVVANSNG